MSFLSVVMIIFSSPFWFFGIMFFVSSPWATAKVNGIRSPKHDYIAKLGFASVGLLAIGIASLLTYIGFNV